MKGHLCKSPFTQKHNNHNNHNNHDNQGVKVVCRIRPPHRGEKYVIYRIFENSLEIPTGPLGSIQDKQTFTFSNICDTKVNQQNFYLSNVSPLIRQVFEQNKGALIFTYGVTNSGKTFTVVGTNNEPGILIQTMRELYKIRNDVRQLKRHIVSDCGQPIQIEFENYLLDSIEYSFQCMEIYNSDVYDLLQQTGQKIKLQLKEVDKRCIAKDCSEYKINEISEFMELYQRALLNKKMAETSLNQMSSRSHTIYKLFVNTIFKDDEHVIQRRNTICIVDLAGSERSKKAITSGQQLAEACQINQSLLTLGKCLKSMAKQGQDPQVVPFRECKLTKILSEYFTVENQILMILNVQLTQSDIDETAKVLKYGALSVNIQLLKPRLFATNVKLMKPPSIVQKQLVSYEVNNDTRMLQQNPLYSDESIRNLQNILKRLTPDQGLLQLQRKIHQSRMERINEFVSSQIVVQNGQLVIVPRDQFIQEKEQKYFSIDKKQVQNPDEIFYRFSQLDLEGNEARLRLLDNQQIENLKVKEDRQMEEINEIVISDIKQFDQQEIYEQSLNDSDNILCIQENNHHDKENQGNYFNVQPKPLFNNNGNKNFMYYGMPQQQNWQLQQQWQQEQLQKQQLQQQQQQLQQQQLQQQQFQQQQFQHQQQQYNIFQNPQNQFSAAPQNIFQTPLPHNRNQNLFQNGNQQNNYAQTQYAQQAQNAHQQAQFAQPYASQQPLFCGNQNQFPQQNQFTQQAQFPQQYQNQNWNQLQIQNPPQAYNQQKLNELEEFRRQLFEKGNK